MTAEIHTRDGATLAVRPIEPGDKPALVNAFAHLSEESRYRRFLSPIKQLARPTLDYLTELDHHDHEALVALTPEGEVVGVARYIRLEDRPQVAEVAVTVVDEWQRRGVGYSLLQLLIGRAEANGISDFIGICLVYNAEMIQMLEEAGRVVGRRNIGGGAIEIEIELPAGESPNTAGRALRAAAHARVGQAARRSPRRAR